MPTTASVIVGVFEDRLEGEKALDELEQAGFNRDDLGFALRGSDVVAGGMVTDAVGTKDDVGAVSGMAAGGVIGSLFGAAAALLIPGIGPVLAGGILATALGFGAAGAAVGGILGAMTGAGVSEEESQFYEKEFHAGKALVFVRHGGRDALADQIIIKHGGYDLARHNARVIVASNNTNTSTSTSTTASASTPASATGPAVKVYENR